MNYRWLDADEIEKQVNPVLRLRNWAELNINEAQPTCRVLGAFLDDGTLLKSLTFQMLPFLGPLVSHDNEFRDSGETSRGLAAVMYEWLTEQIPGGARDFMAIANSPVTERLCQRFGMKECEAKVFLNHPGGMEEE
jgi:hypothetical protein